MRGIVPMLLAGVILGGLFARLPSHAATTPSPPAVTAVPATLQDVPVFLRGLGTVRAFYTVTIKAQVSGILLACRVAVYDRTENQAEQ